VFVRSIEHGWSLEKRLQAAGIATLFLHGGNSTAEREGAVKAAEQGKLEILVCTVIFQEGLDSPVFRSVVVGTGGRSDVASIQRIGRAMRPAPGKDACTVYDIDDKGCGCGGVHNGCRWLIEHTRRRIAAYLAEGYRTTV
jgi:superfamily II DNA or RNA helicase